MPSALTQRASIGHCPMRIAQCAKFLFSFALRPGPWNALGGVEFIYPNAYHGYLHDTPVRKLFVEAERAFRSGCIRLGRPIQLAEYLLRDDSQWSRRRLIATIREGVSGSYSYRLLCPYVYSTGLRGRAMTELSLPAWTVYGATRCWRKLLTR